MQFSGKSLRHVASGFCVHPNGGAASDGVKLILWAGCDEERLAFHFVAHGKDSTPNKKDFKSKLIE